MFHNQKVNVWPYKLQLRPIYAVQRGVQSPGSSANVLTIVAVTTDVEKLQHATLTCVNVIT